MSTFYEKYQMPIGSTVKTLTRCAAIGESVFTLMSAQSFVRPTNTTPPPVSGTFQVGSTITINPGLWSGDHPIAFYQYQTCSTSETNSMLALGLFANEPSLERTL